MGRREFWKFGALGLAGAVGPSPLVRSPAVRPPLAGQQSSHPNRLRLPMDCSRVVRLYGAQAARLEKVRYVENCAVMVWSEGDGTVTW
jgi:hypothetical protein